MKDHLPAGLLYFFRQFLAHLPIVHNACFRHMNGTHTGHMRFQFLEPFLPNHFARYTVGLAPFVNSLQVGQFGFIDGHNHFAADIVIDPFFSAKIDHRLLAGAAIFGPQGARFVVNA